MGRITWPTKPADRCRVRPLKDPVNKCKPVPMPQYKMMIDKQRNSPEKLMPPISRWQLEILRRLRHHGIGTFFSFIR